MGRAKLFSTFIRWGDLPFVLETLQGLRNSGVKDKVFVLQNLRNDEQLIVTFNIEEDSNSLRNELPAGSIPVHRKKEVNTLYSINALNEVIKSFNDGVVDPTMDIPWEHYSNSFLIIRSGKLSIIPTKLNRVVDLEEM